MDSVLKLKKLLKNQGYSTTRPRLAVFEALLESHQPLAVPALARKLNDIDKASVYRTVALFEQTGVIHRVWTGFKSRVELSEEFSGHHHHFTCLNCGKIISFESDEVERYLKKLEKNQGFELTHHSLELSGYCEDCGSTK